MSKLRSIGFTFLALAAMTANAFAAETLTLPAGKKSGIGFFAFYDPSTCAFGAKPGMKIKQPAHGKISIAWVVGKISSNDICNGKRAKGYQVWFTPNAGFRGSDSAGLNITYASLVDGSVDTSRYLPFNIEVK
jgi:hypothetical protein